MVGNGMEAAGPFEEREVVGDKSSGKKERTEPAGPIATGNQIADIGGEAADVRRKCKQEKEMVHWSGRTRG